MKHIDKEIELFESWVTKGFNHPELIQRTSIGSYQVMSTYLYWQAWHARAQLCDDAQNN